MNEELKPCPFCGGEATIYELKFGWYIDCGNDDNCSHKPIQQNGIHIKQEAIDNWNTRAPQSDWIVGKPSCEGRYQFYSKRHGPVYGYVDSAALTYKRPEAMVNGVGVQFSHWMPLPAPPKQ